MTHSMPSSTHHRPHNMPTVYEQSGEGLRELHNRFKSATTLDEFRQINCEAQHRGTQPGLEHSLETAYAILADLARKRIAELTSSGPAGGARSY
jgi:hypothetical protein